MRCSDPFVCPAMIDRLRLTCDALVTDWGATLKQEYYDASAASAYALHPSMEASVRDNRQHDDRSLTLERCIDTFTREEDISEVRT